MQEILKKLNEIIGVCETRVKKTEATQAELATLRLNLNRQKEEQEAEDKRLKTENAELDKRKLLVKTIEEARALLRDNLEEKKRLKAQSDELEQQKSNHLKKMKDDQADIQRQKDKLAVMSAETEKNAKEFRDQVIKQILKDSASGSLKA